MNTIVTVAAVIPSPESQQVTEADRERSNRGQHSSAHRTARARTLRSPYQLGRKVEKGEHDFPVLASLIGVRRKKDEEAEEDIRTQNQAVSIGFRAAYVFDLSQTEGKELRISERVSGNAGEYRNRLVDFVIGQGHQA